MRNAQEEKVMTVFSTLGGQALCASLVAGAVLTVASSAVQANPTVNYNIQVFGGQAGPFANNFNVFGAPTADPQKYLHNGFLVDPSAFGDWRIDYNTTSDPDPSVGSASLSSGLTIQNRMADIGPGVNHLQFIIAITLPTLPANLPATFAGNAGMTL